MRTPLLSIVIPNWNGALYLPDCLDSLDGQSYPRIEVIVVDNASIDDSVPLIQARYPQVTVIQLPENRGFTGACNAGIQVAEGEIIALLNNDTEVNPEWAAAVMDAFARYADVGIVAGKMMLFDQRDCFHNAGDYFTIDGRPGNRGVWQRDQGQFDAEAYIFGGCGGAAAYRRRMFEEIGLLDDDFFFLMEDVDLSWRAQLSGWRALYTPKAIVYHHLSATGGGVIASYYDGRNSILLLTKNLPGALWRRHGWRIIVRQLEIFGEALRAWRGAAARAHLRGMLAGMMGIPKALSKRRMIQSNRKVSIEYLDSLLITPSGDSNHTVTENAD